MKTLSIIGVGAFGRFAIPHLAPHFQLTLYDPYQDLTAFKTDGVEVVDTIEKAAQCDIIILAVPVVAMEDILKTMALILKKGQLVMDIASVKVKPARWMGDILPQNVDVVATHPIFGPESGKNGLENLKIIIGNIRGNRLACVEKFCRDKLRLIPVIASPEDHDKDMAYIQGLTHLIAKILQKMDIPSFDHTTESYNSLCNMVDMIKNDSDALFYSIQNDNPFVHSVKNDFFERVKDLEKSLHLTTDR